MVGGRRDHGHFLPSMRSESLAEAWALQLAGQTPRAWKPLAPHSGAQPKREAPSGGFHPPPPPSSPPESMAVVSISGFSEACLQRIIPKNSKNMPGQLRPTASSRKPFWSSSLALLMSVPLALLPAPSGHSGSLLPHHFKTAALFCTLHPSPSCHTTDARCVLPD